MLFYFRKMENPFIYPKGYTEIILFAVREEGGKVRALACLPLSMCLMYLLCAYSAYLIWFLSSFPLINKYIIKISLLPP